MKRTELKDRLKASPKVLIGLGSEWKLDRESEVAAIRQEQLLSAYEVLAELLADRDYFIVTMATDGLIYESSLGSRTECVADAESDAEERISCAETDEKILDMMDKIFPKPKKSLDTRWQRIVAPCGNETWRQCSLACTKDIWEPGEIQDDICPHCGASLTGNTVEAAAYIEEGYLPQWSRYTRWLAGTLGKELVVLELGVGFDKPGVIRFPFEKTAFFNQKAWLCRINEKFPQIPGELRERAEGIGENSVDWVRKL